MRRIISLGLISILAVLAAACDKTASSPSAEECVWHEGQNAGPPGTCPPNCDWDGKTCVPHRGGVIIDNMKAPDGGPPPPPPGN